MIVEDPVINTVSGPTTCSSEAVSSSQPTRRATGKRKPYLSAAITERRQRILGATMALISECGIDGFNLGDLSRRAKVAQKTLYNSFGSKETLISAAFDYFLEEQGLRFPAHEIHDLEGIISQLHLRCRDFINNREWVRASNFLYFSLTIDDAIYQTLKKMSLIYIEHFYRLYGSHPDLITSSPFYYINLQMANVAHGTVHDWLMGRISDEAFADAVCFGVISTLLAVVKGQLRDDTERMAKRFALRLRAHPLPVTNNGTDACCP